MEDDILSKVIEVETEYQKCIELEKVKSFDWLEKVKMEAEEALVREGEKINKSVDEAIENAKNSAEIKAARIVKDAEENAERLAKLQSQSLTRIILKHIKKILPG